eukprot:jgi/Orpsp1_1/1187473/evm.model.d7180000057953.1
MILIIITKKKIFFFYIKFSCASTTNSKKEQCNLLLYLNGTYPYYYSYNDSMNILYISHIQKESNRGIIINTNNELNSGLSTNIFQSVEYTCDDKANYYEKTITIYDDYKIEVPINEKENIILKSMTDIISNKKQTNDMICSIYDDTLKKAKSYQFPYSTFSGVSQFESKAPISLLFVHLYYQHNETNEGSFEDIVNECCDIIDEELLPNCSNKKNIIINVNECDEYNLEMSVDYLNCKSENDGTQILQCTYIPYKNIKGLIIISVNIISIISEIFFMTFVYVNRNERCIYRGGLPFLICLMVSSTILEISLFFNIGKIKTYKCIIEFWTMIFG